MTDETVPTEQSSPLYDQSMLDIMLEHNYAQATRYGHSLAVLRIDLAVADEEDAAAQRAGRGEIEGLLSRNLRDADLSGRYDDEYLAILPFTDEDGALTAARRLVARTQQRGAGEERSALSLYVGVTAHMNDSSSSVEELIEQAELALSAARDRGAGAVVSFGSM